MILIFCALYPEAEPLIKALELKQYKENRYYKEYRNPQNDIQLFITGTGIVNASLAVGYACGSLQDLDINIHILNFGSCARISSKIQMPYADMYICNKLVNLDSQRTFYPDMLIQTDIPEATIYTAGKVYTKDTDQDNLINQCSDGFNASNRVIRENLLYDMEAAAVYEAGAHFLGPDRMHFLKFVTDEGEGIITPEFIKVQASRVLTPLLDYIESLKACVQMGDSFDEAIVEDAKMLAGLLHASVTMEAQIMQLFRYAYAANIDYKSVISGLIKEGKLPCKDKRAGLKILNEIKENRIYNE